MINIFKRHMVNKFKANHFLTVLHITCYILFLAVDSFGQRSQMSLLGSAWSHSPSLGVYLFCVDRQQHYIQCIFIFRSVDVRCFLLKNLCCFWATIQSGKKVNEMCCLPQPTFNHAEQFGIQCKSCVFEKESLQIHISL